MAERRTKQDVSRSDKARLRRDRYRKKYKSLLRVADLEALFHQAWAVWALQHGRRDLAARCIRFPEEAISASLGQPYHIAPWIMEALLNERLMLPLDQPKRRRPGPVRKLNGDIFSSIYQVAEYLRASEDAEQGVLLERLDVMREMPRMLQRQFEWGPNPLNGPQLYRWAYIYGGDLAGQHFLRKSGISISDFILLGLSLVGTFNGRPFTKSNLALDELGLSPTACRAGLQLLSMPLSEIQLAARQLRSTNEGSAYQPSLLRRTPVVAFGPLGERLRAPIPDLIIQRMTAGLFYDLADAASDVRNEVAARFEIYVCDLLQESFPGLESSKGKKYKLGRQEFEAPDVVVRKDGSLVAVMECKARKMGFSARYSENPESEPAVNELIKGVMQLWRFFARSRLGLIPGVVANEHTVAVLLTLENWTQMNRDLQAYILERAESNLASDTIILPQDRRTVVFASISDLEVTIERSDESLFLDALQEATEDRFIGWMLPNIHRNVDTGIERTYSLAHRIGEVLPWWDALERKDTDAETSHRSDHQAGKG